MAQCTETDIVEFFFQLFGIIMVLFFVGYITNNIDVFNKNTLYNL